jgi:hypothetical protein
LYSTAIEESPAERQGFNNLPELTVMQISAKILMFLRTSIDKYLSKSAIVYDLRTSENNLPVFGDGSADPQSRAFLILQNTKNHPPPVRTQSALSFRANRRKRFFPGDRKFNTVPD